MRAIVTASVVLALAGHIVAAAEDQRAYVGSKVCAGCHAAQFASQAKTGHARSLRRAAAHPVASFMASSTELVRSPDYRFRFQVASNELRVRAHDGKDVMDIPVEWAFGAGDQAVTFVSRINSDWYLEHYFSFYAALGRMAPTPGQAVLQPKTLPEAMGLPYKASDSSTGIEGCFECHSTGPVNVDSQIGFQPFEAGVRCEACHGGGREHVTAATSGEARRIKHSIGNPRRLSATALNEFCGRCHRPPNSPGASVDWSYAWNVRHQPVYLSQSKCMQKSDGKLSCFTCHEPHEPLHKSIDAYNARCVDCHSGQGMRQPASICRVENRSNCVDCHMPRVSPQAALRFTNHWIGIYERGSKLKPR